MKELNEFAAFELLNDHKGRKTLKKYFRSYLQIAEKYNMSFVLEAPTWHSNADWGRKLGYSKQQLSSINKDAINFMREVIEENNWPQEKALISGSIGPRGDGYVTENFMTPSTAKSYHTDQIQAFATGRCRFGDRHVDKLQQPSNWCGRSCKNISCTCRYFFYSRN